MIKDTIKKKQLIELCKTVFNDDLKWLNFYINNLLSDNNILTMCKENKIVSSLQIFKKYILYYGEKIPSDYIAYVSTYKQFRNIGLATELIKQANVKSYNDGIILSTLLPASTSLHNFYKKLGYSDSIIHKGYDLELKTCHLRILMQSKKNQVT